MSEAIPVEKLKDGNAFRSPNCAGVIDITEPPYLGHQRVKTTGTCRGCSIHDPGDVVSVTITPPYVVHGSRCSTRAGGAGMCGRDSCLVCDVRTLPEGYSPGMPPKAAEALANPIDGQARKIVSSEWAYDRYGPQTVALAQRIVELLQERGGA